MDIFLFPNKILNFLNAMKFIKLVTVAVQKCRYLIFKSNVHFFKMIVFKNLLI